MQCLVHQKSSFENDTLWNGEPVLVCQEWCHVIALLSSEDEFGSSVLYLLELDMDFCLLDTAEQAIVLVKSRGYVSMNNTTGLLCGEIGTDFAN